jgi:hypothetical protein
MRKILALILILLFIPMQAYSADLVYYVRTSSAGGDGTEDRDDTGTAAYVSLSAAMAALAQDLTDAGGDTLTIYVSTGSGTAADTTEFNTGSSWTTSATYWLRIEQNDNDKHDGTYDDTTYRLECDGYSGSGCVLVQNIDYIIFDGLQFRTLNQGGSDVSAIRFSNNGTNYMINSIFYGDASNSNSYCDAISLWGGTSPTNYVFNNLTYDYRGGSTGGVTSYDTDYTTYAYNNTSYNDEAGMYTAENSLFEVWNNICRAANTSCYEEDGATFGAASDYNSSDDGTAAGINASQTTGEPFVQAGADANYFVDSSTDDFRLGEADYQIDEGYDLSGTFDYDAIGTSRPQNSVFDLGYMELSSGPPPDFPTMMQGSGAFTWE